MKNNYSRKLLTIIVFFSSSTCWGYDGSLSPAERQRPRSESTTSSGSSKQGAATTPVSTFAPQISIPRKQLSSEENKIIDFLSSHIVPLADGLAPVRQGKEVENAIQTAIKAGEQLVRTSDSRRKMRGMNRYSAAGGGSRGSWGRGSSFGRSSGGYRGGSSGGYRPNFKPTSPFGRSPTRSSSFGSPSRSSGYSPSRGTTPRSNSFGSPIRSQKSTTPTRSPSKKSAASESDEDYDFQRKFIVQAVQDLTSFINQFNQSLEADLEKITPSNQSKKLKFEKRQEHYSTFIQKGKLEQFNKKVQVLRTKLDMLESTASRRRRFAQETPKIAAGLQAALKIFLPHAAHLLVFSDTTLTQQQTTEQTNFATTLQDPFIQSLFEKKDALENALASVDAETADYYKADIENNIKEFNGNGDKKITAEAWLVSIKNIFENMLQKFPDQEKALKIKEFIEKLEKLNLEEKKIAIPQDVLEKEQ